MPNTINFYSTSGTYGCFSNFSRHTVKIYGKTWKTAEHAFQAQKFLDEDVQNKIHQCPTPSKAAAMGRKRSLPLRSDWEEVKDDIMREIVLAKFTQHEAARKTLLSTGSYTLVEHTRNDSYWGDGGDGSGKNMLGIITMETRTKLAALRV